MWGSPLLETAPSVTLRVTPPPASPREDFVVCFEVCGEASVARIDRESLDRARGMRREMTRAEVILWTRIKGRQLGYQFTRQKKIGPYFADFACAAVKLVVEVDGATHSTAEERAYDAARTAMMEGEGWTVVRFWNDEVYRNEEGVVETVMGYLQSPG
jgi:very-short-patch-repair endonuclease